MKRNNALMRVLTVIIVTSVFILGSVMLVKAISVGADENEPTRTTELSTGNPIAALEKEEYVIVSDEQYNYYLDKESTPVFITAKDLGSSMLPNTTLDSFGKEEAAQKGEALFDQVFAEAVRVEGREKKTLVYDFDGGSWLVDIRLLENGLDTGYCASLSFSAEGKLIISDFVRGEEESVEILISEEAALELAREALLTDCKKLYGDEVVLHFEEARNVGIEYRVFKGQHFWEIESVVPTENLGFTEKYNLYSLIRIDAQTGECLMIATPLK